MGKKVQQPKQRRVMADMTRAAAPPPALEVARGRFKRAGVPIPAMGRVRDLVQPAAASQRVDRELLDALIVMARASEVSWTTLGKMLGMSPQGAQQRHERIVADMQRRGA